VGGGGETLQAQTEAELSLDEIREREAAIRQLEVWGSFCIINKKLSS